MRRIGWVVVGAALAFLAALLLPELLSTGLLGAGLDASAFEGTGALGALGVAYLGGVLTSLTPCVYPLIPITLGVFGASAERGRGRSLLLTSTYVFGMAVTFSALGLVAVSAGRAFGFFLASPIVLLALAAFFAVMAASMFGAFELALPQGIARRLNRVGGTGFAGAFGMGLVAGLIAAPCTGPVLSALLVLLASSQVSTLAGTFLLFTYALGVGLPFLLIGVFALRLPRSGAWMEGVKSVFGVALLAMALLYARTALPAIDPWKGTFSSGMGVVVLLSSALVAAGVLLGAFHRSYYGPPLERLLKSAGIAAAVIGLFLRLGAPREAAADAFATITGEVHVAAAELVWATDHDAALARAKQEGKPVMIDFFAEWCSACKELDAFTYVDPAVAKEAERFVPLKIDGTVEDEKLLALYKRYGIQGLPTVVFVDSKGQVLERPRVTGFLSAPRFLEEMRAVP